MKSKDVFGISVFAAAIAMIILQLMLPAVVSSFSGSLSSMDVVSAVSIVSWGGFLIMLLAFLGGFIILSKRYQFNRMLLLLLWSAAISSVLLIGGSFIYLYFVNPAVFEESSVWTRVLHMLDYPALVSLSLADPQPIWIASIGVFTGVFDASFFYLTGGKKK